MGRLPFETGYLSAMSERELGDLCDELRMGSFWREEEAIERIVNDFMCAQWRHNPPLKPQYTHALVPVPVYSPVCKDRMPMTEVKTITFNIPDWLDERTARLFAEIQVREQLDPTYDPTEAET